MANTFIKLASSAFLALSLSAQAADLTPVRTNSLRLPAYPLLTNDPYFSIWSPYNDLNQGMPTHWTNSEKSLLGVLRVDGKSYRFLGKDRQVLNPVAPLAAYGAYDAKYTMEKPADGWMNLNFNDAAWKDGKGAFGNDNFSNIGTRWVGDYTDMYVRRVFTLDEVPQGKLFLGYANDDDGEIYLNGVQVAKETEPNGQIRYVLLPEQAVKTLKKGQNILASHCHNITGDTFIDAGIYVEDPNAVEFPVLAKQKSATVTATSTYYTFTCGPVELQLVFTAPQLITDLDLLSTPVNYISYQVKSTDGKAHQVQFFLQTAPDMAINANGEQTQSWFNQQNGLSFLKTGTINQPVLGQRGDQICINWGYAYLVGEQHAAKQYALGDEIQIKNAFMNQGKLPASKTTVRTTRKDHQPIMAYVQDLGNVQAQPVQDFVMMGYDDDYSIEYMHIRYQGYWKHEGMFSITDAFQKFQLNYESIMDRCRALDALIYDDALQAGGKQYAEICASSYRQVMAAHKLFKDREGHLLWFSKENNSNGCVNTVDLTYPSAPLFLIYNPELQKGQMTSILEYSKTGRWTKPFAAHDLGTYPIANGQAYGGDMPVEESGNMLTLCAAICHLEKSTAYVEPYWDILTTWTDYLVEYGLDPENQLCTDDFAGHWAHNANLSIKAIMGIQGFAELCRMKGLTQQAEKYGKIAKDYAQKWEQMAREGDHYRLAFDRENTWSQKYNLVWDKLWNTQIFPSEVIQKEMKYYLGKQNKYGLPLDIRKDYTKSDWIMWTAAMAADKATFGKFAAPLHKYINETQTRVPISDWSDTKTGLWIGFRARSVIGGYWMQVLAHKGLLRMHE